MLMFALTAAYTPFSDSDRWIDRTGFGEYFYLHLSCLLNLQHCSLNHKIVNAFMHSLNTRKHDVRYHTQLWLYALSHDLLSMHMMS